MKNIQTQKTPLCGRADNPLESDSASEDGFSLSRRSVLTEKLLPARWEPEPRRRGVHPVPPPQR